MATQRKQFILKLLKVGIAIYVVFYLFRSGLLTKESFLQLFTIKNIPHLFLSGLFFIAAQMLSASRLVLLLTAIKFPVRFFSAFKLVMIGNVFNAIIPGTVGGDVVKGIILINKEEIYKGKSLGILIVDRMMGLMALTFIGGAALVYLLQQQNATLVIHSNEIYIALSGIGVAIVLAGACLSFSINQQVRKKMRGILSAVLKKSIFYYLMEGFGVLAKKRSVLANAFIISILIQLLSLTGILILSSIALEASQDALTLIAVFSIIILLSIIPVTPGNIGWTELLASFGLSVVGSKAGAEIFIYWRIVTVCCSLPGVFFYLAVNIEQRSDPAPK